MFGALTERFPLFNVAIPATDKVPETVPPVAVIIPLEIVPTVRFRLLSIAVVPLMLRPSYRSLPTCDQGLITPASAVLIHKLDLVRDVVVADAVPLP